MDRKTKQTVIGTCAVGFIVFIIAAIYLIKTLTPSKEIMDLKDYYYTSDDEVVVILQDNIYDRTGLMIDGVVYVDYETVVNEFNHRFYWDSNENILTYTTPTELIRAEVGSSEYSINKSKNTVSYQIVKTKGDNVYIAIDFVKKYSDIRYEIYKDPSRIVIEYKWGDYLYTTVRKDTQVRFEASIKSPILEQVAVGDKLLLVDVDEESNQKFTKVMTSDGVIGYVKNKFINSADYESISSSYEAPVYTHITNDNTINMVWHQTTNMDANSNLYALLDSTKGVNVISPTWFSVSSEDGAISSLASQDYVDKAHNLGMEVWALIDDFTNNVSVSKVLSRTSTREKLVNGLISEVIKYNIDGINVDFELITSDSAKDYLQFLRELSIKCRTNGIVLSVDNYVPAAYNMFYDRAEQGEIVDYVVVMGYDEYHASSETSGSVSSKTFFENGLNDTLEEVDKERVIMAMPFYTRVWKEVTEDGITKVTSTAYAMEAAWNFMLENGVEPTWNDETGQYYAEFELDGATYKCWLEEEESIEGRMKIISDAEIAGVSAWRLGFEKPDIWNVIIKYVN